MQVSKTLSTFIFLPYLRLVREFHIFKVQNCVLDWPSKICFDLVKIGLDTKSLYKSPAMSYLYYCSAQQAHLGSTKFNSKKDNYVQNYIYFNHVNATQKS